MPQKLRKDPMKKFTKAIGEIINPAIAKPFPSSFITPIIPHTNPAMASPGVKNVYIILKATGIEK